VWVPGSAILELDLDSTVVMVEILDLELELDLDSTVSREGDRLWDLMVLLGFGSMVMMQEDRFWEREVYSTMRLVLKWCCHLSLVEVDLPEHYMTGRQRRLLLGSASWMIGRKLMGVV
jgi:hypothetical protein